MGTQNLLYRKKIEITKSIYITIPTVGEIIDDEDQYYSLVSVITAMPIDLMCQLNDIGIDFTTINEYELFLSTFRELRQQDTSLIFGDLDLSCFEPAINEDNGMTVLLDRQHDIVIDRVIYERIADTLRKIHHLEKNIKKPGNEEAKKYMLEREEKKRRRKARQKDTSSQLESLIISMVNAEQYKYDFEGTRELSIYQFNECVRQVLKKVDYDNRMHGVYSGTISVKDLSQDDLSWLNKT